MSETPINPQLKTLIQEHQDQVAYLDTQMKGMGPKLSHLRLRLVARKKLHKQTITLLKSKKFTSMDSQAPNKRASTEVPKGFAITQHTQATETTYSIYEGRSVVAYNISTYPEALKLAKHLANLPEQADKTQPAEAAWPVQVAPEPEIPAVKDVTFDANLLMSVHTAMFPAITRFINNLTEEVLGDLDKNPVENVRWSGVSNNVGRITFSVQAPSDMPEDALKEALVKRISSRLALGRSYTSAQLNALTILDGVTMDPVAKAEIFNLVASRGRY